MVLPSDQSKIQIEPASEVFKAPKASISGPICLQSFSEVELCFLKMASKDNSRMKSYKNRALDTSEMRRRREEEGVQLRKAKREEQVT